MNRLLAAALLLAALSACQRETQAPAPPADTTTTSAAPAAPPASGPILPPTKVNVAATPDEDVGAGRTIATQGAPGAAACMGCHGANGEGNAQAGFPRIAALGRFYIGHQLDSYADGSRNHAIMSPIAKALDPQQRAAVAAFYAQLGAASDAKGAGNASEPMLVAHGDEKRGIQACANCHGPQGSGDAGANPYLAGQHAQYFANAIAEWKDGSRNNDPSAQMPAIAKALTDADAKQLAAYFAGLPPPAPRLAQVAAAGNTSRVAVQSGPAGGTAPLQGTGTQQGSALTGGAQGPGSGGAATNPGQTNR